ncbi:radical SAM/SPASM domain-containing protein [Pectinatus frisingensis]|uniref:radical SAM/SPASM domain-containing protein n=1 Tax=Pectinatus frisingensis TaxID=865 RepID=UPI0018C70929|nr:radical SAM protein [Pectinatus frisingensis]
MTNKIKMLVLSLTGQCNFSCRYCYASEHDKGMMDFTTAAKAINLAACSGERFVLQFSGGEPLLNFNCLKKAVEYVSHNNLPACLQLQTNASLLTDDIARFLCKNNVAIGVSLDGNPEVNDKFRLFRDGRGTASAIMHGLDVLKRNNIAAGITCVVTAENVRQLPDIVEFVYYIGNIRKIGFDLLREHGRGINMLPPTGPAVQQAMLNIYERARQMAKLTGYKMVFPQKERISMLQHHLICEFDHCFAMNGEAAFVDARGKIYACSSLVGNERFCIGNVDTGIDDDLLQKTCRIIRKSMTLCRQCNVFGLCGGGCFTRWYGAAGSGPCKSECALKKASIADIVND